MRFIKIVIGSLAFAGICFLFWYLGKASVEHPNPYHPRQARCYASESYYMRPDSFMVKETPVDCDYWNAMSGSEDAYASEQNFIIKHSE